VHELSLVQDILEIGEAEARRHGAARITRIKLLLGDFAGVVRDALEFSFEVARAGTLADGAELVIESVPLQTRCGACGAVEARPVNDFSALCAACAAPVEIVSGRELRVEYVEIE
jgi:hydrogenase nickel incorporation protein HypA/HybF